jgi:pimeloyl-ACP methyl ester carboxylesterase
MMCTRIAGFMIVLLAVVISGLGCSTSSDNTNRATTVSWGLCPDYINKKGHAECAFVTVPKNYEKPYEGTIDLFIWRIKGALPDDRKKGQIWFIQGGPGDSSLSFANMLPYLASSHPEWDYYSMDHRGVGNSSCLECPMAAPDNNITSENAQACYNETQALISGGMSSFSTTNAARDINTVIDLTRSSGKVFLYGVSYGTYLVQRLMTLFPESVDGTILDSIVPANARPIDNYDSNFNIQGMDVMKQCTGDATCSAKMSSIAANPWDAVGTVFEKVDNGMLCSQFSSITRVKLRQTLAYLSARVYDRALIPPVIYRLNRCNESDKAAISPLFGLSAKELASADKFRPVDKLYSTPLADNIVISELYNGIPPWAARTITDAAYFSDDQTPTIADIAYNRLWPKYDDPFIGKKPDYDKPVLMMNSTVDGNTPLSLALGALQYLDRQNQYFVAIPWAAHGSAYKSPIKGRETPINEMAGIRILFDFVSNPYAEPDISKLDDVYILEFSGSSYENISASRYFFGVSNMWE